MSLTRCSVWKARGCRKKNWIESLRWSKKLERRPSHELLTELRDSGNSNSVDRSDFASASAKKIRGPSTLRPFNGHCVFDIHSRVQSGRARLELECSYESISGCRSNTAANIGSDFACSSIADSNGTHGRCTNG